MAISATGAEPPRPHIANRIIRKIHETIAVSPVTIVIGPTGCGKSTQVPPALLLDPAFRAGPILCTQPRRLAVVAVATRVAQERNVTLGGTEVGYHVGQSNKSVSATKLVFTTAGILLEELRTYGVTALTRYKAVVIDECHERSPESDLVLALVKSILLAHPNKGIRVVLMSATFDHGRYQRYFADVPGCERIENITLETATSFESHYANVETHYLEETINMLSDSASFSALQRTMRLNPDMELVGNDNGRSISEEMLRLIKALILHCHSREPIEGVFVVFAPTYRHLEQIYYMLRYQSGNAQLSVGVLHSSVDMEFCLRSMRESHNSESRKILLASAIAESSVTIPGVTCIIDLCRALQVKWDMDNKSRIAKTIWSSKSICDQRKGRTGRTCPGKVFRLVPRGFYVSRFESWEVPQLTLSSCRDEVLKLLCASSVKDPSQLLAKCLDPPPPDAVLQATQFLKRIGACVDGKKKIVLTKAGELMADMPFQVEHSQLILDGARLGVLFETLALFAIRSHKPAPIVHHFGDTSRNEANAMKYYPEVDVSNPHSANIANFSAFLYWDAIWNGKRLQATISQFAHATGSFRVVDPSISKFTNGASDSRQACCNVWSWTQELEQKHIKWCEDRAINPTSVRGIAELIDTTLNIFYAAKFEPEWLRSTLPTPSWRKCEVRSDEINKVSDILALIYGVQKRHYLIQTLSALSANQTANAGHHAADFTGYVTATTGTKPKRDHLPIACIHFLQGNCTFGDRCRHSHAPFAVPPLCRYYMSGNCSYGSKCLYSHKREDEQSSTAAMDLNSLSSKVPILSSLELKGGTREWFSQERRQLLLIGEGNFEFTKSLQRLRLRPAFSSNLDTDFYMLGSTDIYTVNAPRIHQNDEIRELVKSSSLRSFSWNFPHTGIEEDDWVHESLILGTFHSLNELLLSPGQDVGGFQFALALQGDQFSRWMVMRSALRTGWQLSRWGAFDSNDYPGYQPRRANGEIFPESSSRFYVFVRNLDQVWG